MSDIVERLREIEWPLTREAADEIERLRTEVEWLREVVAAAAPAP
jgi:hypothetical protein